VVVAVNWFEGGRRISKLLMVLVGLGGAAYVVFINSPMATLTSRGPTMPWFVDSRDCPASSYQRYLWDYDWGDSKRGLALCFLDIDGRIPYAIAPTPQEELRRREKEKAENEARMARGEPPTILLEMPWFYTGSEYDSRVQAYVNQSVADFKLTQELRERLRETRSTARWRARKQALNDATPWVFGICAFIWLFTTAMGWIIRGFAGVPKGQDFKPPAEQRQ
jgi:hypothetical protein